MPRSVRLVATDVTVTRADRVDLPEIARLARVIWHAHYPGIISGEQIAYMLDRMYAMDRMEEEMERGGVRYYVARRSHIALGFAASGPTPAAREYKLHKLYVLPESQRQGIGRALLDRVCEDLRQLGGQTLVLAVNKRNAAALAAYRRYGFQERGGARVDIGGGFVMDDFILAARLDATGEPGPPGRP